MPVIHSRLHKAGPVVPVDLLNPADGSRKQVLALLDTGASGCLIDRELAREIGLQRVGNAEVATPSQDGQPERLDEFEVGLAFQAPGFEMEIKRVKASAPALASQGFQIIVGRNVLERMTLIYDGPSKTVSLYF